MRCGNEPTSGTYYEVVGERIDDRPPILMIHGGGATGAGFRSTLEGDPGWADLLAARGHEVWVTDWAGSGRSGNRNVIDIEYADVVDGYRNLLRHVIGEPVVVIPHSMGGATTWQLVEHDRDLVAGVVAVAASFPGNIASPSEVLSDDGTTIRVLFKNSGAEFTVDRGRGYIYEDDYIYKQGIHTSTRFPMDRVAQMRAGLVPFPPRMLLQRMSVIPGLPPVADTAGFAGLNVRLIAGTEDPAHTQAIEQSTVDLLRSWGCEVELVWLGDRGISGNGHFMMFEDNNVQVLDVIAEQVDAVMGA
jgi:pimeloyl-ACP methyl ester carboxylesterase